MTHLMSHMTLGGGTALDDAGVCVCVSHVCVCVSHDTQVHHIITYVHTRRSTDDIRQVHR